MAIGWLMLFLVDLSLNLFVASHRALTKCLLLPLLAAYYVAAAGQPAPLVLLALAASWLGDCLLEMKGKPFSFAAGLLAFLAAHILYTAVFLLEVHLPDRPGLLIPLLLLPYIVYILLFYRSMRAHMGRNKQLILLYGIAISVMSLAALLRAWPPAPPIHGLTFLGSVCFIISDSILAVNLFRGHTRYDSFWIMATYACAQLLIVLSLIA
ncbi:MAG: lysoplasmalogenase [Eubacteriales bacterium]|nr:lysoplasmalogenase [Eubacteriales bacterium]MDD4744900.1 lysoplasmalogenase [Eubacteriales bacterium]